MDEHSNATQRGVLFWVGVGIAGSLILILLVLGIFYAIDLIAAEALLDVLSSVGH